ncbi:helix-turn-helix transcriptional regulator [Streptomyces zingiberis]|uniref:WYL domain-containing protein n=1 Tax=Streptomyces zingiberis TaxID=2053010 RepID=A0ABX1BPY7_9ACTN|nr:WYL domain-containing protein [Streptomyces zingiberis]NJP99745.1 WYL domain-containing protein [Streptomyces zingiberis]
MRAARLIRMVLLLQSRPSMTAAELARELEVSVRTVTRDALALSEAGVPVYADRGRAGGYRLIGGYRTRLTGLARGEAEALFLSGVPSALRDMGLADTASAARLKVTAALLPELSDTPSSAAQRFHLDAPGWWHEPVTPPALPLVAEAVWGDRLLTARYRRRPGSGGAEVERVLEPYGLVLKAGVWYLAARAVAAPGPSPASPSPVPPDGEAADGDPPGSEPSGGPPAPAGPADGGPVAPAPPEGAAPPPGTGAALPGALAHGYRVYRVERLTRVEVSGRRFVRDEEFDLPGFWRERAAGFARAILRDRVVLRLTPAGARQLPQVADAAAAREALAAAGAADERGRVTVRLPVESLDVAYHQLLALGPDGEVVEPAALRARFAEATARAAALYAR